MEENTRDGESTQMSTGTQQGGQVLPNETMNRTVDQTCTQKLTIPTLEKQDQANASMWWRKFVQYIKMTKEIELSIMTNSKEILPQYRDQLETDIKDIFTWAIGQNAITEIPVSEDEDGQGKRTELTTTIQTLHAFQTTFHTRKKRTPQQSRFL